MTDDQDLLANSAGAADLARRAGELAALLPEPLQPLATLAFNYRWSWLADGEAVFRDLDPERWELAGHNPVRLLSGMSRATLERRAGSAAFLNRLRSVSNAVAADLAGAVASPPGISGPVSYLCAEYGIHESLPTYSGGLGVLAGDTLKEASDRRLPFAGLGLLYRRGYQRQRLDLTGRQLEHWVESDLETLPLARVTTDGVPLELSVDIFGWPTWFQVWRVDVGRTPLFLMDADVARNDDVQRWYTARLYEGDRGLRLAQYVLLGMGGMQVLRALGIEPAVIHLNEGHPALAAFELVAKEVAAGTSVHDALTRVSERFVFTTHTPVPAGNETYDRDELLSAVPDLPTRLGMDKETLLDLFRTVPGDRAEPAGFSQLAIRVSRRRNAVSRLHGEVARRMWQPMFPGTAEDEVPITHVTNGAHLPTFLSGPFRSLFDRHLGAGWLERAADPATWEPVAAIPDEELWEARCAARADLVDFLRRRSVHDRLQRGEEPGFAASAAEGLDAGALTLGFARRLATYKRVHLLAFDPERATRLVTAEPPVQLVLAGKAHPRDEQGKEALVGLFALARRSPEIARRAVVVEDYDIASARLLVAGCDVWVNLPRRPMEASGTSGMKSTFNGGLQLSVLDGWWAEAYDGTNGWAIPSFEGDPDAADAHDAGRLYDLLEREVVPLFHERGADGIPHLWCEKVKQALVTCAPRFTTARMLGEYVEAIYPNR